MTTILVVDDDAKYLARIRSWLAPRDLNLVCTETSRSALIAADARRFDLALVDYRLRNRENGIALGRILNARHQIPFIIISGFLDTATIVEAMRSGASDVLDKPLTAACLLGSIQALLNGPKVTSEIEESHQAIVDFDSHLACSADEPVAKRLAGSLLRACSVRQDPKTISKLSRASGVSPPVLRSLCELCSVKPRAIRDLTRFLRAICRSGADGETVLSHLSVNDTRTALALFGRAAIPLSCRQIDLRVFFQNQGFVPTSLNWVQELAHLAANSPLFQQRSGDDNPGSG